VKAAAELATPTQLSLKLCCNSIEKTIVSHRYMAYPLSVSPIFRLEQNGLESSLESSGDRAYLYRMNTSPGLLAGDDINMSIQLGQGTRLYLADQAATKVHTMPQPAAHATIHNWIEVGDRATLEFLPEPLILFADSALSQTTDITLHAEAGLSLGEIILPGRLARGEAYQFRQYFSRLRVRSLQTAENTPAKNAPAKNAPAENLWFTERINLLGQNNPFAQHNLFASGQVLGSLLLILPATVATPERLNKLSGMIDELTEADGSVDLASSVLPTGRGLFVKAISKTTRDMQRCFKKAINCVRQLQGQTMLPYSV